MGFDDAELASLLTETRSNQRPHDEDAVPEVPPVATSALGDLWLLGEHRLLCGDALAWTNVSRLIGTEPADMSFSDPPYNVDYERYTEERLRNQGRPHVR